MQSSTDKTQTSVEDAMFTKKYVGPVDCASCEKGIVNLNGLRAENLAWNKLPFREPNARIASVSYKISNPFDYSMVKDLANFWPLLQYFKINNAARESTRTATLTLQN